MVDPNNQPTPQPTPDAARKVGGTPFSPELYTQLGPVDPNADPHPFSTELSSRLSRPLNPGESIFDPQVLSRYFDDPSVPEKDKQTIMYAIEPNRMTQAFDDAIKQSVGEPLQSKGILARAISSTIDIAGKPIGKVFDALQYPSDRTEQIFGTVLSYGYDSDLSLSERWKMGRLTYESYGQTGWWKFNGDDKLNEWSQQVSSGQKTIDEVMAEHEHGVPDLVGKMILDPLWLLGGLPGVPGKLFKAGEKGAEVYKTGAVASLFRGLSEGIRLEQFGSAGTKTVTALEKLPGGKAIATAGRMLFGGFVPSKEKILDNAMAEWRTMIDEAEVGPMLANWRGAKGLFDLTPQAKADQLQTHLIVSTLQAKAGQDDIVQLARAVRDGNLDAVPTVFGSAFLSGEVRNGKSVGGVGRILFEALREQGIELSKFPSMLKNIAPDQAVWDAAETAAKAGDKNAAELIAKSHRNGDAFVANFQNDVHEIAFPALQRWQGVRGEMVKYVTKAGEKAERFVPYHSPTTRFTNVLKFGLSTTMLNRPGFVALNYTNNGMTLAADWGFSRGVKYWLDPLGRRGWKENGLKDLLVAAGLVDEHAKDPIAAIKLLVGDRSMQREMLGLGTGPEDKLLGIGRKWWAPMVTLTAQFDMGARTHAFYEMFGRAHNAVWKFEGTARGLLPGIPNELAMKLGPDVTARLRGAILAAGPDEKALRKIADTIAATGRPPLTAEHYLESMADSMKLEGDARQSFMDMFEPAFKTRISAILADAGNSTERLKTRLDTLKGALRQQEHQAREMDNLMPRPRDYQNLPVAVADHESLMAERDKEQLIQLRRYLTATGSTNVDQALSGLAQVQNNARQNRYVLQYTSQLLGIAPERLASDVLFQMVPESMRPAVQAAHRELVLGLDEVIPERGAFYEVLGDLATRWENHSNQTVSDLLRYIQDVDITDQPTIDFFESMARVEGETAAARDRVFADMINNHPGADAPDAAADWISTRWTEHYRELDNIYNEALQREADIFGFEHRFSPHARGGDNPTVGEMLGVRNSTLNQYMDFVEKQHVLDREAQPFAGDVGDLKTYIEDVASVAPDAKATISLVARRAADFTMLNYDRRYGIDHWLALVYPYAFWPTRSMWHWAQRGISRPGAVAATAKLYDLIGELNSDAGIPQRFRQSLRLPIPFLDKSLQGGTMYFDPIKVLFPTADWSVDNGFGENDAPDGTFLGIPRNVYGAVNQWAKVVGPGVNPFIDTALQYAGGDDRALYLKYKLSSLPFMIPGPRMLQAAYSFTQSGEDPENLLDDATKEKLATGQALDENRLKQILAMSPDDFDLYRAQRVLANQVGDYMLQGHSLEERQNFANQALNAMFTRKGKMWREAQITAQHESGLSIVTGWIFGMPVRQYPSGEATSRGIQELYRAAQEQSKAEGGGDRTADFNKMFPEMEVKNAAVEIFNGSDKQDQEIAGALFAQELDKVHAKYDARITELNGILTKLGEQDGFLSHKDGRRAFDVTEAERDALVSKRAAEIDNLDKTYTVRNQTPSFSRTPRTRALQELEGDYYKIELPDRPDAADFEKQKAKQAEFVGKLAQTQGYSPLGSAIDHYAKLREFDRGISAAYDAGDRDKATSLIEERRQLVLDRTAEVKAQISQKEFTQHLARNKRMPTTQELEANQASDQMSQYFAIKDRAGALGYSNKETSALAGAFWDSHPLLEKYYGSDPDIPVHTFDDIKAFDRMESIWEQFYALDGGSQSRIDYLAMTLSELNSLRRRFGLRPVALTDPYWAVGAPPPRYEGSLPQGY